MRLPSSLTFLLAILVSVRCPAQSAAGIKAYYDDSGRIIKVIDSSGNEIDYTYDAVGNIIQITRGSAPSAGTLAILSFTPQSGGVGQSVTILGQGFSATAASNTVKFNGAAATVVFATTTTLVVTVPATATTGPISVTVAGNTVKTTTNFTLIASPGVQTISPNAAVGNPQSTNLPAVQVSGANLTGSTFSFSPLASPAAVTVNSATISSDGTSATLNVTVAAGATGGYTLVATNALGLSSSVIGTSANTLRILGPDNDDDGDGLTNVVEGVIGTNPLVVGTSGAGLPDGWQLFYAINPLDPSVAGEDYDNSGLTVLQDFQAGLSPRNPSRVAPTVSQVFPANNQTAVSINSGIVVRFAEPLLTGTTLTAAQNAIATALGSSSSVSTTSQQNAAIALQAYMNRTCCGNSVISGTVTLTGPGGAVAGAVTPSNDSLSAAFVPSTPLDSNTTYTLQAVGVRTPPAT
jgi:YD repeat-containing protein